MKKFIYLTIISFLFVACSNGGDDENQNETPNVPKIISPANNKLCINNYVAFEWEYLKKPNNDLIIYQIEIAKDNQFNQIVETLETESNYTEIELELNTAYYWRIKTVNSEGISSKYSKTYKFYTEGETIVNHLPFSPELISPAINTTLNATTATLKWNAADVDSYDFLSYDVYFGTANPPVTKISENNTTKTIDVTLQPSKEYFWKVVVKDGKGGETVGQIWRFKTY
ncbi:fibronectin type III domain-containing protein [Flavobacterium ajazii]|uniref:hypothetical protein n=1 Tax=Flavobacterium ajazii TaxID=2692318 RepID=UPI0013D85677|nr:hypothetical protein [Flavobacterium ajazii]